MLTKTRLIKTAVNALLFLGLATSSAWAAPHVDCEAGRLIGAEAGLISVGGELLLVVNGETEGLQGQLGARVVDTETLCELIDGQVAVIYPVPRAPVVRLPSRPVAPAALPGEDEPVPSPIAPAPDLARGLALAGGCAVSDPGGHRFAVSALAVLLLVGGLRRERQR